MVRAVEKRRAAQGRQGHLALRGYPPCDMMPFEMPLFREKAACPNCGATVRQPKDPDDFLCWSCKRPGPWASDEQRSRWEQEVQERQRAWSEQEKARLDLRRRALEQAASLTPIQLAGLVAQKAENVYVAMPASWRSGGNSAATTRAAPGSGASRCVCPEPSPCAFTREG